jgi:hypothetical protein
MPRTRRRGIHHRRQDDDRVQRRPLDRGRHTPLKTDRVGAWAIIQKLGATTISFPIRLAAPLDESHVHHVTSPTAECPGTVENPTAEPGNLCVYESMAAHEGGLENIIDPAIFKVGASTSGAMLTTGAGEFVHGTFAVTAL